MAYTILELKPEDALITIPDVAQLSLLLDFLRPHYSPRLIVGDVSYLVAQSCLERKVFQRALLAVQEYSQINLETETVLHLPASSEISHLVKLRVAKARASRIKDCFNNALSIGASRRSIGSKQVYTSPLWEGAISTWSSTYSGEAVLSWGSAEKYASDNSYIGDLAFIIRDPEEPVRWLHIPEDDRILLEHNFPSSNRRINFTVESANARDLGLTEIMLDTAVC